MSYLVLARKYRPKNFENIVGQDHVVRALSHALESQRRITLTCLLVREVSARQHCRESLPNP